MRVLNSPQGLGFCFSLLLSPPGLTAKLLHQHRGSKQEKKADPGTFGFYLCSVPAKPSWPPQPPEWFLLVPHPCLGCNSCPFPAFPQTFSLKSRNFPAPHPEVPAVGWLSPGKELPVFISSPWKENKSPSLKLLHIPRPLQGDEWNLSAGFPPWCL